MLLLVVITFASFGYHWWMPSTVDQLITEKFTEGPALIGSADVSPTPTPAIHTQSMQNFTVHALQNEARPPDTGSAALNPRYMQKPKEMTVEFEMVNGLAVAFGDTILGQPLNGFSEAKGLAEVQHPRYWNSGIIPYLIKPEVVDVERVKVALEYFNQNTNIKFVPYENRPNENQTDALVFEAGSEHCYSYLGRMGGLQPIIISERCGTSQIMHELMHALGFVHEQSRTDRDQFVQILWDNIEEKYRPQFAMVPEPLMESYLGSAFDSKSIMMYESNAFAIKKEFPTIRMKNNAEIQPAKISLSPIDIDRVNRLYPMVGR